MTLIQSYWQQYKAVHTSDWLVSHFCSVTYHDCSHLWRCSKCSPVLVQHSIMYLWIHWIVVLAITKVQCLLRTGRVSEILLATDSAKHVFYPTTCCMTCESCQCDLRAICWLHLVYIALQLPLLKRHFPWRLQNSLCIVPPVLAFCSIWFKVFFCHITLPSCKRKKGT